jgi:hypothetical protein
MRALHPVIRLVWISSKWHEGRKMFKASSHGFASLNSKVASKDDVQLKSLATASTPGGYFQKNELIAGT